MRTIFVLTSCLLLLLGCTALAQEGHPLTGTWHGEWTPASGQANHLVLYMKYNTKEVEGAINPGPRSIPLKTVTVDATKWTVHLEGEGKDQAGNPVKVVADGKIDDLGSYNRTISGTWMQGAAKGSFKIRRD